MKSPSELPDDLDLWPTDPCRLLGVTYETNLRDLRRAYAHLVRKFKPEHYPEHFRRLCDAYETLKGYARHATTVDDLDAMMGRSLDGDDDGPAEMAPVAEAASPAVTIVDEVADVWKIARTGDFEQAYRGLLQLERTRPNRSDVLVRLYWLLVLDPKLDTNHDACEWLVKGLRAGNWDGPLWSLYLREMENDPEEAIGGRAERLLFEKVPPEHAALMAPLRWTAALLLGKFDCIAQDVPVLRKRIAYADANIWARLLSSAAERMIWGNERSTLTLARSLVEEIEQQSAEHLTLEAELDRLDYACELADSWRDVDKMIGLRPQVAIDLHELVLYGWNEPFHRFRPRLMYFLRSFLEEPTRALIDLDHLGQHASIVLDYLSSLVSTLFHERSYRRRSHGRTPRKALARWFFESLERPQDVHRHNVLIFCIEHGLTVEELIDAATRLCGTGDCPHHWSAKSIPDDPALCCACNAWAAFWS